jgi:hypothetical protein
VAHDFPFDTCQMPLNVELYKSSDRFDGQIGRAQQGLA